MSSRVNRRLRAVTHAFGARLRVEAGFGLIEAVIAMSLFLVVSTALSEVLTTSVNSHGFTMQQTLGQEAADAQIEDVRALPYDSVGTTSGNPPGSVAATESASAVGISALSATVTTSIHYVGDGIPDGYNDQTNYKQVVVSVTRNSDGRNLATESTYIAPPTRAPYGGINQVALGVIVTDVGDNEPVAGVPIALQTGPSAPRSDTTDSNGGVLFAGMTANPTSGPTAYYNVVPTLPPGYAEMPGDIKQAQLGPGQITNLSVRVYQPATIYVHLTSGGSDYSGAATITVKPPSGSSQGYAVSGDPNGEYSIPNQLPNGQYTLTASTAGGLISKAVAQTVPNDYPTDLTSSFALDLAAPTGTLSVTAVNGGTPIAGVAVTVTGGPSGVTLNGTTDPNGVVNFASVPAGAAPYTVTGTYGAATFQQTGITVATNTPTPVTLGVVAGSVKVSVSSGVLPVPGATLTLTGPNGFSATGTSDGSGTFTFTNVGSGSGYAVTATDGAATAQASAVTVNTGATTNVVLSLSVGTIKVNVTDGSSNPLAGVPVTLTGPNSLVVIGTTNSSGVYSFPNIGSGGGYSVSASAGATTATASGQSVSTGATTSVNLTLSVGSIQATVTEGGVPLPNAKVTVTGPNAYSVTQTANAAGVSTFPVGSGSGYTVSAADGPATAQQTGVSVSAGSTTSVPLDIAAGSIAVTVSAGTTGMQGVAVTLTGPNGYSPAPGTTNASGVYTFARVPVGTGFTVTATTAGGTASQSGVTVATGPTTPVALSMPTGSIRAVVMLGSAALSGQTVTVTGPGSYSASGTTDSTGLYVFDNVPVGSGYTVSTTYGATVQQSGLSVANNGHTDVLLTIPAGALTVTVKNQSGTAIAGAPVTLAATNGITVPAGTTAANGTYTFSLPAGSGYTVTAKDGSGSVSSASQTVSSGATTNVTLTISTGSILVTVKNQSGTALAGASPGSALTLTGPNSFSETGTTGSGSTYTFPNVPVGAAAYSIAASYGAGSGTAAGVVVSVTSPATAATVTIQTGSVAVTVKDQNGVALNGASLTLSGAGSFTATGSSGAGNTYTFANVPVGTASYTVGATVGAGSGSAAVTVSATSPATPAAVTIQTGSVAVTVKDQNGVALNGVSLTLSGPGSYSATGSTGAGNNYTFADVPVGTGSYTVAATLGAGSGSAAVTVSATSPATAGRGHDPDGEGRGHDRRERRVHLPRRDRDPDRSGRLLAHPNDRDLGGLHGDRDLQQRARRERLHGLLDGRGRPGAVGDRERHERRDGLEDPEHPGRDGEDHGQELLLRLRQGAQHQPHGQRPERLLAGAADRQRDERLARARDLHQRAGGHGQLHRVGQRHEDVHRLLRRDDDLQPLAERELLAVGAPMTTARTRRRPLSAGGESGFTLIEMLVTMFIIGIVFAAFGLVISTTVTHSALITNESVVQNQVRTALDQLTEDLREATTAAAGATSPFVTAGGVMSPTSITFYAPDSTYSTANPTAYHLREISYQLSAGNFQRSSAVSSNLSGPPWTIPALGSWVTLIGAVVNSAVFTYYDGSQPPVVTTDPAAVRTVVMTVTVSVPGTPHQFSYSDTATLRETPPS